MELLKQVKIAFIRIPDVGKSILIKSIFIGCWIAMTIIEKYDKNSNT